MLLHLSGKHTVDYEGFCLLEKPTLIQGYYFGNIDNAFEMESVAAFWGKSHIAAVGCHRTFAAKSDH